MYSYYLASHSNKRDRQFELSQQRLDALTGDRQASEWVQQIEENILEERMAAAAQNACEHLVFSYSLLKYLSVICFTRLGGC